MKKLKVTRIYVYKTLCPNRCEPIRKRGIGGCKSRIEAIVKMQKKSQGWRGVLSGMGGGGGGV